MKMLKISLVAALALGGLLACATVASAQDANKEKGKGKGQNMTARIDNMAKELNLTEDQKTKVTAVMTEQGKKMQEMRGDGASTLTPEERRAKMMAMREETNKKMKAILTPEQYTKWEKNMAEMRGKRGGPGGPGGGEKKPQ